MNKLERTLKSGTLQLMKTSFGYKRFFMADYWSILIIPRERKLWVFYWILCFITGLAWGLLCRS